MRSRRRRGRSPAAAGATRTTRTTITTARAAAAGPPTAAATGPPTAAAPFDLGILGIVFGLCCPLIGLILSIIAIVMANGDMSQIQNGQMDPSGEGNTRGGQICGYIGLALSLLVCGANVLLSVASRGTTSREGAAAGGEKSVSVRGGWPRGGR